MTVERETIEFDVLFVGAGPANLAGAIRLMQLGAEKNLELEVGIIEKGKDPGAHALSGAILNPRALAELLPDYRERGCPVEETVTDDGFYLLTPRREFRIPLVPRDMHNRGCHVVSLSKLNSWLASVAEEMGVMVFSGFAGKEVLYAKDGRSVAGVRTGDKGLDKLGKPKANFEPGIDLLAKVTVFGEGPRGSLVKEVAQRLEIFAGKMPQVYETGVKEVIELPPGAAFLSTRQNDIHTLGYPLGLNTPGGGFIYRMEGRRMSLGFLTGLSYENPALDPEELFYRFKRHPFVARIIEGGKIIEHGAKTVSTGGYYTMPQPAVDGAMFIGACAAIHNAPALKGIHAGMKSGMLAAEAVIEAIEAQRFNREFLENAWTKGFDPTWLKQELLSGRNFSQALAKRGLLKLIHLGAQYLTGGRGLRDRMPTIADSDTLAPAETARRDTWLKDEPKPVYDDTLHVDKLTGVYLSKTLHREDQPCHILVHDTALCVDVCYPRYGSPCTRFCPGSVYAVELDEQSGKRQLKLTPANCYHCKTCDIKDPFGNITWTCPEGGDGPGYSVT